MASPSISTSNGPQATINPASSAPRAAFIMEQQLGHATYYKNLQGSLADREELNISWIPITYAETNHFWERLPGFPRRAKGILRGLSRVREGLRSEPWDVAFYNTHVAARLGGGLLYRNPYVITTDITPLLHDGMSDHYGRKVETNPLIRRYKHNVHQTVFQRADRILPWSNWVRDSLIADYAIAPEQIEVIPPGVDLNLWHPGEALSQSRNGNLGDNNPAAATDPLRILFVGGDFYRKGGDLVLRAFAKLPQGAATLDIVTRTELDGGPGITIHNGIEPNSPKLLSLYQSSSLFVFPTQAEAFGIVAAEAAATGLPVIATDVGGLSDIVAHGENGFLFQPDDENQLTVHLNQMIESPELRLKMGIAGRERAEKLFDAQRNAERILAIVQKAAGNKSVASS